MNNNIKITLDLDSSKAAEAIEGIALKLDSLLKEIDAPHKLNIEIPAADEEKDSVNVPPSNEEKFSSPETTPVNKNAVDYKKSENEFQAHQVKLASIEREYSAERMKSASEENRYKLESTNYMLLSAGELFGKQAGLYKTISIAEATMSAYNAANAALLPPPVGAGPILGEIQAAIVLMNSLKRVEKIAASQIPGYAKGGIVIGENGPEVIENMQDYAAGRGELIEKTILAVQNGFNDTPGLNAQIVNEIKNLRGDLNKILERPALAFLDDKEAKKVYLRGGYFARKTR